MAPWLALAAIVLRLALPVGWMPSTTVSAPIVMCGGPMAMPEDGAPKPAKATHHDSCPFGAAPHFATLTPLPLPGLPTDRLSQAERPAQADRHTRRSLFAPQIPRGPPLAV